MPIGRRGVAKTVLGRTSLDVEEVATPGREIPSEMGLTSEAARFIRVARARPMPAENPRWPGKGMAEERVRSSAPA